MPAKSKKKTPKAREVLEASREMTGPAVVSMVVDRDEAVERIECGFQPVGDAGDRVIMVGDTEAVAQWGEKEGQSDG